MHTRLVIYKSINKF